MMDAQPATDYTVRELTAQDAPAVRKLFEQVFKKEMSEALWDWKYRRPLSRTYGVFRNDELVAHYGGLGNMVHLKGRFVNACQIVDVMVSPAVRHGVRNKSPFFLAASHFIDHLVGIGQFFETGYGFPNDRAMAIAAHLNFYTPVGRMWELSWDTAEAPRVPWLLRTVKIEADNFPRHRAALERLWAQHLHDLSDRVVVRKDAAFVEWRYLRQPHERYEVLLVKHRLTGKPVGLCVLKAEPERALWMEALAPLRNLPALAQMARAAAWRMDRRKLVLWCSEPDVGRFGSVGETKALPITTPANARTSGPALEDLHNRWWLLPGDTDFL